MTEARRDWFPGLAAVRVVGATCVVGTHVAFYTGRTTRGPFAGTLGRLDVGVALFFVLTGFLLFRPYAQAALSGRAMPRTGRYLRHRALRILPAYWLVVIACMALLPPLGSTSRASDIVHHLTLTQIYGLVIQHTGLTQAWSLCVEVSFYVALPLLARLVLVRGTRTAWLLMLILGVASAAWTPYLTATNILDVRMAGQWLPSYLDWFIGGMALALAEVNLNQGPRPAAARLLKLESLAASPGTCWSAAGGVFAIATSPLAGPTTLRAFIDVPTPSSVLLKNVLYLVVAVLVVLPLVLGPQDQGLARHLLATPLVQWLGEISYGIFLWHLALAEAVLRLTHRPLFSGGWLTMFAETWCLTIPVAYASYRFVERPLMSWRKRPVFIPSPRSSDDQMTASPIRQSA